MRSLLCFLGIGFILTGVAQPLEEAESQELTGRFLVATSQLRDPRFSKTVIYILEHGPDGAMGIVVNRPLGKVSFSELSERMGVEPFDAESELLVHYGGPVALHRGFIVHSTDVTVDESRVVADGIAVTTNRALLESIARNGGPEHYIFALGYAGWAPKQLESEMDRGSWVAMDVDASVLFADDPETIWEQLMGRRIFRL